MLSLEQFVKNLEGVKSGLSIAAYRSDLRQYFAWLTETDYTVTGVERITRGHIEDYLAHLSDKGQTGTTRVCKLISLQVFFAHLVDRGILPHSPAEEMKRPRREQKTKHYLRPDEYSQVLAEAAGDPRNLTSPPFSRQFFDQIRLRLQPCGKGLLISRLTMSK